MCQPLTGGRRGGGGRRPGRGHGGSAGGGAGGAGGARHAAGQPAAPGGAHRLQVPLLRQRGAGGAGPGAPTTPNPPPPPPQGTPAGPLAPIVLVTPRLVLASKPRPFMLCNGHAHCRRLLLSSKRCGDGWRRAIAGCMVLLLELPLLLQSRAHLVRRTQSQPVRRNRAGERRRAWRGWRRGWTSSSRGGAGGCPPLCTGMCTPWWRAAMPS